MPEELKRITSPLCVEFWRAQLGRHPVQEFAHLILKGMEQGFKIGFNYGSHQLKSKNSNMLSAVTQAGVVTSYLEEESRLGRIVAVGRLEEARRLGVHISPFGVIPKKNKPNKWRLILDLSSPQGSSVNDGAASAMFQLMMWSTKLRL